MPEFQKLSPQDITIAHFNPIRRINRTSLSGLILSIQQHGILEPLALTKDRILADGHRRFACANILELKEIPVAIHTELDLDAPALWVVLNAESMNLTPAQWLDAVVHGLPLDTRGFPESMKRRIMRLRFLLGKDGLAELVEMGRSPNILDTAERIQKYCGKKNDEDFVRKTLLWLLLVGNSFSAKNAISEEIPIDILEEAIEEGKILQRVWDLER
jgi:ParB-like chromosome segregation protein Spo0J